MSVEISVEGLPRWTIISAVVLPSLSGAVAEGWCLSENGRAIRVYFVPQTAGSRPAGFDEDWMPQ